MKATLHFDLSDGGDRRDYELASHALEFVVALGEFKHWLREKRKYGDLPEAVHLFADEAWSTLHLALDTQGVAGLMD